MFFFFTCGEHTFRKDVPGYEGIICHCRRCNNMAARVVKHNPWFTFCFIPVIPLSISGYQYVSCHICNTNERLEDRPDVIAMAHGGGVPQHPPPQQYGPPQGWGQQPPPQGGHAPMRYG